MYINKDSLSLEALLISTSRYQPALRAQIGAIQAQRQKGDQQAETQTPLSGQTQAAEQPARVLHQR